MGEDETGKGDDHLVGIVGPSNSQQQIEEQIRWEIAV